MRVLKKIFGLDRKTNIESFLERKLLDVSFREAWIDVSSAQKVYAHIHKPLQCKKSPGIVFVPGGISAGTEYDSKGEVSAMEVAGLGFAVLNYDPTGRGKTDGKEDHWGEASQRELYEVIRYFADQPEVDEENIGILSFSIGITIASGALARYSPPNVKYLYDWEGPSNRSITTIKDTHKPLAGFPMSNKNFWDEREAARYIGDIKCAYFRYQAEIDHVQGDFKGHATELVNLATKGKALWTQLNGNPKNITIDESRLGDYEWVAPKNNHSGKMLKYLLKVQDTFLSS